MQRSTISYRHLSRNQLTVTYLLVATSALPCEIKKNICLRLHIERS